MNRWFAITLIAVFLSACESHPPAPVIERAPSKPAPPSKPNGTIGKAGGDTKATAKDWRPESYIVKKGDTLFSISLEFGYDYKEIASANNIAPPYPIKIGQKLSFAGLNSKLATFADTKPSAAKPNEDGVVTSAIKTDTVGTPVITGNKAAPSTVTPALSEPRALRETYSIEAMNRKPTEIKSNEKPVEPKSTEAKVDTKLDNSTNDSKVMPVVDDENVVWNWPTQGKIVAGFNDTSSKGIDINGSMGQAINAAAMGKVIYAGSDLRGYGKLVIIKHNKAYLSVYAHNSKILVKEGQMAAAGQKIAEMGNTDSNSINLHFEIRHQGKSVDPTKYLPQN